jgi:hypothetical protein
MKKRRVAPARPIVFFSWIDLISALNSLRANAFYAANGSCGQ